jgi:hypothetical protein
MVPTILLEILLVYFGRFISSIHVPPPSQKQAWTASAWMQRQRRFALFFSFWVFLAFLLFQFNLSKQ